MANENLLNMAEQKFQSAAEKIAKDLIATCYKEPQTKADRIRAMSDEELATHLHDIGWDCHLCAEHRRLENEPLLRGEKCDVKCVEHCLEWLKQPAEEEAQPDCAYNKNGHCIGQKLMPECDAKNCDRRK